MPIATSFSKLAAMKNTILRLIVLILMIESCTCNEIKEKLLPTFNINIPQINLTVPPLPIVTEKEVPVGALKIRINMDSTIKANTAGAFGANAVHAVTIQNMIIKVLNADANNNLSNFETGRLRIYSDTASTDIAVIRFPTTYSDSISVTPTFSPDISNYLKRSNLSYNLFWKNRKTTTKFLKLNIRIRVNVK